MGRAQRLAAAETSDLFTNILGERRGLSSQQEKRLAPVKRGYLVEREGERHLLLIRWLAEEVELGNYTTALEVVNNSGLYNDIHADDNESDCLGDLDFLCSQNICQEIVRSNPRKYSLRDIPVWPDGYQEMYSAWRHSVSKEYPLP